MRIVLDANVFVSALIAAKGAPARLLDYWRKGKFDLVVSAAILGELERVLHYPRLQNQYSLPDEAIQRFVHLLQARAIIVAPSEEISVIDRDPTDNRYLECATHGEAEYIISGDHHLLDLKEYEGIRILAPLEFLALLTLQDQQPEG